LVASGFYALNIIACPGIHLDKFTLSDEQGDLDNCSGFDSTVFQSIGSGIAPEAGFGIGDFQGDERRQFTGERSFGVSMEQYFDLLPLLQELGGINERLWDIDLFEGLEMHEVVIAVFPEKVLVLSPFYPGDLDPFTGIEGVRDDAPVLKVLELGTDERGSFAGFDMLKFDNAVKVVVEFDDETIPDVCRCSHKMKLEFEKGCKNS
jgi:hypothetical protein